MDRKNDEKGDDMIGARCGVRGFRLKLKLRDKGTSEQYAETTPASSV
jgi:hypothetical protein